MIKRSNEIYSELAPAFQKLMDDVLSKSDGSQPLEFGDGAEYQKILGKAFDLDINAVIIPSCKRYLIFLNQLDPITNKEELGIAHELGHLWLLLQGFPQEKAISNNKKQEAYDCFFGSLNDSIHHAIFYPWLQNEYEIDLYTMGKERLVNFIKKELPARKNETQAEKLFLIRDYIVHAVRSTDKYWLDRLRTFYQKKFPDLASLAKDTLSHIHALAEESPDPDNFNKTYRKIIEGLNLDRNLFPSFLLSSG